MGKDLFGGLCIPGLTAVLPGTEFVMPNPDQVKEGAVVVEGWKGLALAGAYAPYDVEYIKTTSGRVVWHNDDFRHLPSGPVRLVKKDGQLVWQVPQEKQPK